MYFEKYVKGKEGQTLWIRNLQLSIYGVPLSILYTCLKDGRWAAASLHDRLAQGTPVSFDALDTLIVGLT